MADDHRDCLLASYADMGEAMVIQNVLETEGIRCRMLDLDNVPPHLFGMPGAAGRSVGLWVSGADVDRARSLLTTLGSTETTVDAAALEAEALAAIEEGPGEPEPGPEAPPARPAPVRRAAGVPGPLIALIAAVIALLAWLALG